MQERTLLILTLCLVQAATADTFTWTDNAGNNNWWSSSNWNQDPGSGDYPGESSAVSQFVVLDGSKWGSGGTNHFDIDLTTNSSPTNFDIDTLTITTDGSTDAWVINDGPVAGSITIDDVLTTNLDGNGTAECYGDIYFQDNGGPPSNPTDWRTSGNKFVLHGTLNGSDNVLLYSLNSTSNGGGITLKSPNPFSGTIRAADNEVDIDHVNALANATVELASTATLSYINGSNIGDLRGQGPLQVSTALNIGGNHRSGTFTGALSGSGTLRKKGSGIWSNGGTSTHTGTVFIDAGQIRMTGPNGLSGSLVWLNTPNGLDLNGQNPSIGGLGGSGSLSLVGSSLTIDGSHDGLHLGVISGTGAIKINMTGSQAFGSSNTYSGGTELFTGTIVVDSEGDLGDTSGALAFGDGTFHATATHTQTRDMLFAVIGANGTIDVDNGRTLTWAGTITEPTGGPTLNKTGSGTLALTNNANFYGGKLVIDQGLVSTTDGGLNATAITLNTNDALLFADASTSLGSLYGSGSLDVPGGKSVSIGNDGRDFAYAGDIGGSGALSKAGSGTFTYSGACSLGTGITLDAGTLELDGDLVTPIFTNLDGDSSTTLRGQGLIQSALVHDGSIAPDTPGGSATGTIQAGGMILGGSYDCDLDGGTSDQLLAAGTLNLSNCNLVLGGTPTAPALIIARYGTLGGTFASISGLPAGYTIDYAYDDGTSTQNIAIVEDSTAPTVSITTTEPAFTNADSITYDISFSEPVTGLVDDTDFYITGTTEATTDIGATVIVNSGDDVHFTLTLHNLSGDGFLGFRLRASQIADLAGNHLASDPFAPGLTIDNTPPVVTLVGGDPEIVGYQESWSDPGTTASDNIDPVVDVSAGGDTVNPAAPGSYTLTYDATDNAGNAATQVTREVIVLTAFKTWTAASGLTAGVNDGPGQDPDKDGRTNLEEFAFDGDPLDAGDDGKRRVSIYSYHGLDFLSLNLPVRSGMAFSGSPNISASVDGITYTVRGSHDLLTFDSPVVPGSAEDDAGLPPLSPGWEYRSFWLDDGGTLPPRGFLSMEVEED